MFIKTSQNSQEDQSLCQFWRTSVNDCLLFSSELDKIFQQIFCWSYVNGCFYLMKPGIKYLRQRQISLEQGSVQVGVKRQQNAAVLTKSFLIFQQFKKKVFFKKSTGSLASSNHFPTLSCGPSVARNIILGERLG